MFSVTTRRTVDACFNETMRAITVKFLPGEMHFNVATLGPFLQRYRQDKREGSDGMAQKIKREDEEGVYGKYTASCMCITYTSCMKVYMRRDNKEN